MSPTLCSSTSSSTHQKSIMEFPMSSIGMKERKMTFFQKSPNHRIDKHWSICTIYNAASVTTFSEN